MKIIRYFESDRQEYWLAEIGKSDWHAGKLLHKMVREGTFFQNLGEKSDILLLTDGDRLISYCTLGELDDIQPTDLTPWMGFVYTFPEYRGHRYVGLLFEEIRRQAEKDGFSAVYISTPHVGLYEKYGCEYLTNMTDLDGKPSRIYRKRIV